ncbi:MAG: STAS domain-containing protein [Syntrophobacteraceae bacterium]|nr:STAS domain-containing protein [Syntrophobacteraceae bacterium]
MVKIPILKLGDILLTSLPEDLIDEQAMDFQGDILEKVRKTEARGVVIDITALQVVDSFMARIINDTANMVKLLGAEVVLCGMNPSVALTLVEMGRELIGVRSALNLEQGVVILRELMDDGETKPATGE